MNFLSRLFGSLDSTGPASDRIAIALNGIADDLEATRGHIRQRIGLDDDSWQLQAIATAPAALPVLPDFSAPAAFVPDVLPAPKQVTKRGKK